MEFYKGKRISKILFVSIVKCCYKHVLKANEDHIRIKLAHSSTNLVVFHMGMLNLAWNVSDLEIVWVDNESILMMG